MDVAGVQAGEGSTISHPDDHKEENLYKTLPFCRRNGIPIAACDDLKHELELATAEERAKVTVGPALMQHVMRCRNFVAAPPLCFALFDNPFASIEFECPSTPSSLTRHCSMSECIAGRATTVYSQRVSCLACIKVWLLS